MTKEDTIQILDLIEDVLSRCTSEIYTPNSDGAGYSTSYVDPEKVRKAIREVKGNIILYGDNP
jgi:hypothetical protein